jgi:threonine dehydratase
VTVPSPERNVSAPTPQDLAEAQRVVRQYLEPTRTLLLTLAGQEILAKDETAQPTGSFKIRGALSAVHAVKAQGLHRAVLTASAGNHGLGIALASRILGIPATIVVPTTASTAKVEKLAKSGATIVQVGQGFEEAERHALDLSRDHEVAFISPYNDPHVIAGQATIFSELFEAHPSVTQVLVPVGGGGLLAGVLLATQGTGVTVIGVQPSANAALTAALSGTTFVDGPTAADGLAGDLEPGSVTLEIARAAGVPMVVVSEDAIARGVVAAQRELGLALEASAAVGLASISEGLIDGTKTTAVLLTGRNVSAAVLSDLLRRGSQTL